MFFQFSDQRAYIERSWRCGYFIAISFVLFNLFAQVGRFVGVFLVSVPRLTPLGGPVQLVPVTLVVSRKFVRPAIAALLSVVVIQVGSGGFF